MDVAFDSKSTPFLTFCQSGNLNQFYMATHSVHFWENLKFEILILKFQNLKKRKTVGSHSNRVPTMFTMRPIEPEKWAQKTFGLGNLCTGPTSAVCVQEDIGTDYFNDSLKHRFRKFDIRDPTVTHPGHLLSLFLDPTKRKKLRFEWWSLLLPA